MDEVDEERGAEVDSEEGQTRGDESASAASGEPASDAAEGTDEPSGTDASADDANEDGSEGTASDEDVRRVFEDAGVGVSDLVLGTVTLHTVYGHSIRVVIDWAHASRLLRAFEERRSHVDQIDGDASPFAGWVVVDLSELVLVEWSPGVRRPANRTVVDPVVA